MKLIVSRREDGSSNTAYEDIPTDEEKEMLRYYYYVKHGVDTVHVAPLDEKVLAKVSIGSVCFILYSLIIFVQNHK